MSHDPSDNNDKSNFLDNAENTIETILFNRGVAWIVKNAPDEAQAGSILGGAGLGFSGVITVAQGAIVGVSLPLIATVGGFVAAGVVIGGAVGWVCKKFDWC